MGIHASNAFSILSNKDIRVKSTKLTMSSSIVEDKKPIYDPMGLYPSNSLTENTNDILTEDSDLICDERIVRDPMGLYPDGYLPNQPNLEKEVRNIPKSNTIYDPLGLYPKNSPEKVA